ncbi:organic cation/carnitine transporter 2-like isoform X2 [Brevipalpus obovatus]
MSMDIIINDADTECVKVNGDSNNNAGEDDDRSGTKKETFKLLEGQYSLEQVFDKCVGSFEIFQKLLTLYIVLFIGPLTSMNMISQFLILLTPPHKCSLFDSIDGNDLNSTLSDLDNSTLFINSGNCLIRPITTNGTHLPEVSCPKGWQYDHDLIYPTLVSEKDWVCHNQWQSLLPHSVYWCGATIGCFVFGALSDRFGRVWTTAAIFGLAGFSGLAGLLFADHYPMFVISRGLMGFAFTGSVTLVLVIEFVGLRQRLLVSTGFVVSHSLTSAAWSTLAYIIGDWRILLMISSCLQFTVPIISIFTPESVRWLYSKGQTEKGAKILKKIAKFNGREIPDHIIDAIVFKKPKPVVLRDFIRYPRLTKNFVLVGIISILNGIVYIGANLYAARVVKNPFLVLTVNGTIDFFAGLVSKALADKYGRKKILMINLYITFILYDITYFLSEHSIEFMLLFYTARLCVSMAFNILYLYAAEIVPTSFRSRAVSTRLCLNNFGALIAPILIATHVYGAVIPLTLFGLTAVLAGILTIFLPETLGVPLPETCEDANRLK